MTMKNYSLGLSAFALLSVSAFAQTFTLTPTTFSAAVAKTDQQVCLTSATGVVVPTFAVPGTKLFADFEPMDVQSAGSSTTCFVVSRIQQPMAHVSGAIVYVAPPDQFFAFDASVGSACTASTLRVLPMINTVNGHIFDCRSSGQWIQIGNGTMSAGSVETIRAFCTGAAGSGETDFLNGAACSGATTATARYVVVTPGTIANLRISLSAASNSANFAVTMMKNGSDTTLTTTVGTTACATAAAAACKDVAHSVTVAAGDVLTFKIVAGSADTGANSSITVEKF